LIPLVDIGIFCTRQAVTNNRVKNIEKKNLKKFMLLMIIREILNYPGSALENCNKKFYGIHFSWRIHNVFFYFSNNPAKINS
jgi:hypothetical protein